MIYTLLTLLSSVVLAAPIGDTVSGHQLLGYEGIYELDTIYTDDQGSRPYQALDRMVIVNTEEGVDVSLARTDLGSEFVHFRNVQVTVTGDTIQLAGEGVGPTGVYGEIRIQIDRESAEFSGYFTDNLALGYKSLTGRPLSILDDYCPETYVPMSASEATGAYQGRNIYGSSDGILVIRQFSSGLLAGVIRTETVNKNYTHSKLYSSKGILTLSREFNGRSIRLVLIRVSENELRAVRFSSTGIFSTFSVTKTNDVLVPWSQ